MNLLLDSGIGAEDLQLAIFKTIFTNLNDYIAAEETRAAAIDTAVQTLTGRVVTTKVERFEDQNIHFGHRPSMIEAPILQYPSMAVMTYRGSPAVTNQRNDYGHSLSLLTAVEVIVKSGPYDIYDDSGNGISGTANFNPDYDGEDMVGRRVHRTAEAIFKLMQDFQSLDGTFEPSESPPTVQFGDIFARDEHGDTGTGARWYWQGVRMEFVHLKQTISIDQ